MEEQTDNRQTDGWTGRQTNRQTGGWTDRQKDRLMDGRTDRQTYYFIVTDPLLVLILINFYNEPVLHSKIL